MATDRRTVSAGTRLSRRSFLKLSVAAAGAATLGGPLILHGAGATNRLNIALVGCGGQGRSDMGNMISAGANIIALCDVDQKQIDGARKAGHGGTAKARAYTDFRKLIDEEKALDGVIIATPDHWHAPLCRAFMKAGKHIYCEKPLTHCVGEAREIRELYKASKVVTQMGNQGSASVSVRRSVEVIKAGALGQIRDVYAWLGGGSYPHAVTRPTTADPIPATFNWDFWVGPSPMRPFNAKLYHPWNWRAWYDFGSGQMGDWGCHVLNIAFRALDLGYPEKIENFNKLPPQECNANTNELIFHFAARGNLDPVKIHWGDGGPKPDAKILQPVLSRLKKLPGGGTVIVGEKGIIYADGHNLAAMIQLHGEPMLMDINHHEGTKNIPTTLPRARGQHDEWLEACKGGPKTYSDFDTGGHLTEIALSGVVAIRMGKTIEWDGEAMAVKGHPEADVLIHTPVRKEWAL